jgi:hypothetical protein
MDAAMHPPHHRRVQIVRKPLEPILQTLNCSARIRRRFGQGDISLFGPTPPFPLARQGQDYLAKEINFY